MELNMTTNVKTEKPVAKPVRDSKSLEKLSLKLAFARVARTSK